MMKIGDYLFTFDLKLIFGFCLEMCFLCIQCVTFRSVLLLLYI